MREADVQAAFVAYLIERGWDVQTDAADYADVRAKRGAELLVGEVKGTTSSPGLDVDTGYGQVLRCMSRFPTATHYVLVGPERLRGSMTRVSAEVRRRLRLDLFVVDDLGRVHVVAAD